MKAPPFAYVRPATLSEALRLLEDHGASARLLAGGQSLVAALNLRLSTPEILIDISRIPDLAGIKNAGGSIHIGALATHAEIEHSSEIARHLPLLAQAAPHIAHVAIRNAGTIGGSVVMADPAAEWPACCVALDARFVIATKAGERRVKARDFFKGVYTTDLRPGEILTAIEFPALDGAVRSTFLELARRRGDYAIVGIAALAKLENGALRHVHLAYLGAGETPVLARAAMATVEGKHLSAEMQATAASALARDLKPASDIHSTAATKLHLARVLTGRALAALAS
jgi:aerobic carbon-monoxide dehydrogenase medium subunit